ncbi:MAG TPA: hypothetical protein VHW91_01580 [Candidatus Dormibacteraeota bacterium]|jgi:hypothetical protein|nr:hypothetical protein [Candidatus Dormibacteraeota bacterium]
MTLKACPQCGYRYNAPENQTCGKCKGWLGAVAEATAVAAPVRTTLVPANPREALCYLPVPVGVLLFGGVGNPIVAAIAGAFGLLMSAMLIRVVRLDMERFSKGVLIGIVVGGIFILYLLFLLIFGTIYSLLEPLIQSVMGHKA